MQLPTQSQIDAVKRYAINAVTTVMGFAGIAALLARYGIDSKGLVDLINGLGSLFTSLLALIGVIGTIWTTLQGFKAASPANQSASTVANLQNPSISSETKREIIAQQGESLKLTMLDPATPVETKQAAVAAAASTVTTAAAVDDTNVAQAAKVALLDGAAALPEVIGDIKVTDKSLALNTASEQIKAAA